ncbi:MAG: DegT/DnrJ/EryC1/StrS family aminotransferase [Elusimicrobia bacterium]|nr:DegT/DnrJ/EryC1/StrS family aminotransferase [Elusimicrobiota bacterium]
MPESSSEARSASDGAQALLASVYAPPLARRPWRLEALLAPAALRYYGLGRAALTDVLRVAGLTRGDPVLFPGFLCGEAVDAARALACEPRFYPVGPGLEPALAESEWPRAAAVVAVDYFGFPQDLEPFRRYARRTGALLIEDNAHGLFSRAVDGAWLGLRADAGIFSLRKTMPLANGAVLALPPGSRLPLPDQGAFQDGEPVRFRAKGAARAFGRVVGYAPLRLLDRLARAGARSGGGGRMEGLLVPPALLTRPLTLGDPDLEVARRRALYAWCDERARPLGARPAFAELPAGVSPFTYPYRAPGRDAERLAALFHRAGLEVFSWPGLPPEVEAAAPAHYRDLRCVRFLW